MQLIILIVIGIFIVSALGINLRGYWDASPEQALNNNYVLVIQTGRVIWTDYIHPPINYVWEKYIEPLTRGQFINAIESKFKWGTASTTLP